MTRANKRTRGRSAAAAKTSTLGKNRKGLPTARQFRAPAGPRKQGRAGRRREENGGERATRPTFASGCPFFLLAKRKEKEEGEGKRERRKGKEGEKEREARKKKKEKEGFEKKIRNF
jgi:hypothetical protein